MGGQKNSQLKLQFPVAGYEKEGGKGKKKKIPFIVGQKEG